MKDYHFDATTSDNFLGGGSITHPFYGSQAPFTFQISYSYKMGERSKLGLLLSHSDLREVLGVSTETGYEDFLFVSFSNFSIIPIYTYQVFKVLDVQAGPALMFNSAKETSLPSNDNYNKISAGLLAGLNLRIWNTRVTYGKLSASYLFATYNRMGPFTADSFSPTKPYIPETSIGFGHFIFGFVMGFHI